MSEAAGKPATTGYSIGGIAFPGKPVEAGLYPVATPIGNLKDISLRALEVLAGADLIVCEDSRVTAVLLDRYGISKPLAIYHEHNAARERPRLLAMLKGGMRLALVSDAGTPLISDPGFKLVEEALEEGIKVIPVPGASAILSALVAAGLPTDTFLFLGFLPHKAGTRRNRLADFRTVPASIVTYESPHRAAETLADMADVLGADRPAALCRELTKRFEEVRKGTLAELAASAESDPPRGEIVLVVGPPLEEVAAADDIEALLRAALETQGAGQAAAEVAKTTGRPRKELYTLALKLKAVMDGADDE